MIVNAAENALGLALGPRDRGWNLCWGCGTFVKLSDLLEGRAAYYLDTPDSDFSTEAWACYCPNCAVAADGPEFIPPFDDEESA